MPATEAAPCDDSARGVPTPATSKPGAAAAGRWKGAGSTVLQGVRLSNRLNSLRDALGDSHVDWSQLQCQRRLGSGAFATVTQASFSTPLGRQRMVAVKQMRTELLQSPQDVQTFVAEVKLLRRLKHQHIVAFYGCGWPDETEVAEAGGSPPTEQQLFFLQELLPGGSLQQLVLRGMTSQQKVYSNADALRWALQIALALEYLHTRNPKVIHRDLKLENVLLTSPKPALADAKLADFGLARLLRGSMSQRHRSKSEKLERLSSMQPEAHSAGAGTGGGGGRMPRAQTWEGGRQLSALLSKRVGRDERQAYRAVELTAQTGSLGYMAPEVLLGEKYNEKADVFSFGIVLYNLFHRSIPILHIVLHGSAEDLEAYAHQVAQGFRPDISAKVPPGVRSLIERCWKGLPELRPSMGEVVRELQELQVTEAAATLAEGGGCCSMM